jgi:hypothetical protein
MKYKNLLLVSGTGRNSGKTTFVCRVVEQFSHLGIVAIKISQHFHNPSDGLIHVFKGTGFEIYEESSVLSSKDSSRMLKSGASKVFYVQTRDDGIMNAFAEIYKGIPSRQPIICESPSLINHLNPGLFIQMNHIDSEIHKKPNILKQIPDLEFTIDQIRENHLPLVFTEGRWSKTED